MEDLALVSDYNSAALVSKNSRMTAPLRRTADRFVIASSVMLTFVSFWRASALILSDLGSSAYYVGGIAERAVGKSAPWLILAIMLFSYAVRAVYIESCSMFVRGGVYKVVHEAMGRSMAKFSVSALLFDYVLTGPISAVSAGLYLAALINESGVSVGGEVVHVPEGLFATVFAVVVVLYFWLKNLMGVRESSSKALLIMQITTVMVVLLIAWCFLTLAKRGAQPVPLPTLGNLTLNDESLGWLKSTRLSSIPAIAILVGLGHSLLAMSGEESLAQVNRELAAPKLKNLKRTGLVIFLYSLIFTSLVSFFAVMIIPDAERPRHFDNLIGGLSMFLVGPGSLRLAFHIFVVLVGALILSGAVNTSIMGANGVLNRVAEDGVLPDWTRKPNRRYGTTHRLISLIAAMQFAAILISHGDVYLLGEAYAFGVVWSFAMKTLAVIVLRYTRPGPRPWRVPLNLRLGKTEVPVGLILIALTLFSLAIVNLFTKKTATIAGLCFTAAFFTAFTLSEWYRKKHKEPDGAGSLEKFRCREVKNLTLESLPARAGNILVVALDADHLRHLAATLRDADPTRRDMVLLAATAAPAPTAAEPGAERELDPREVALFSKAVHCAEEAGKPVKLLAVSSADATRAALETAGRLRSSRVIMALPEGSTFGEEHYRTTLSWETLPPPRPFLRVEVISPNGERAGFKLGVEAPIVSPGDDDLAKRLLQELSEQGLIDGLRHRDVVGVALRLLEVRLRSGGPDELEEIRQEAMRRQPP